MRVLPAAEVRPLAAFAFGFGGAVALALRPRDDLGDFLRNFLDIRLPFVAFGRSIIGLLRVPSGTPAKIGGWASLTAPEYGYTEFDAAPVLSLNEPKAG